MCVRVLASVCVCVRVLASVCVCVCECLLCISICLLMQTETAALMDEFLEMQESTTTYM